MLHADILTKTGYGSSINFASVKNETILTKYHNVYKIEDVLYANEFTGVTSIQTKASSGKILVGEANLNTDIDTSNILG